MAKKKQPEKIDGRTIEEWNDLYKKTEMLLNRVNIYGLNDTLSLDERKKLEKIQAKASQVISDYLRQRKEK